MVILLASKIQKPVSFKECISRENMVTVQNEAMYSKVIFINAPTGYGKTTSLVRWTEDLDESIAWLTVDETDNDALNFFKYVVYSVYAACKLIPESEIRYRVAIANHKELNEMWDFYKKVDCVLEKPIRLIIDDFHHITEPELLEMIHYFVMNLPESLSICFASRHHPPFTLAVLHSMFQVTEITRQHLRITMNDLNMYLKQQQHQNAVVWGELMKMEGWPVGIRQVLQKQENSREPNDAPFQQFTKSVLANDLWNNFSKSAQQFLLTTSILDSIDLEICDALLETTESVVHLKEIEEKGFFVESVEGREYRYHHLFSVALQQKLEEDYSKEFIVGLHKKVAGIYFKRGNVVQAITHAVKGEAYPLASTWMMNYGEKFITDRQTFIFTEWCYQFEQANIPLSLDLQLLFAFALLTEYEIDEADRVTTQMTTENNRREWNNFTERNGSAPYDYFLIKSYITTIRMGGVTEVAQWLQKGFDLHVEKSSKLYLLPLQFNKKEPILSRTRLGSPKKLAVQEYQQSYQEQQLCQANKLSIIGYYHGIQAETLYAKGFMKEAREQQVEALLLAHHFQDPGLLIPMYILSCKLYLANGDIEKAHETVQSALLYTEDAYWIGFLYTIKAFIYLKQDRIEEAEVAFSKMQKDYVEGLRQHPFVVLVDARIHLKKGQWEKALKKVLRVKFEALEEGQVVTFIEATILESSCYAYKEYWLEMSESLQDAMTYSKEYGYTQLFIEEENMEAMLKEYVNARNQQNHMEWTQVPYFYVERLVQATKEKNPALELLTPREQDVFSLLVLGETNHKIAKNLALTEGSVRIYLTSIYEKLSVKSRTQAMLKAYK